MSYPVVETVFTMLRRVSRQSNPGLPDAAHLHQLVYKRLMRWTVGSPDPRHKVFRNSMTSPYLWLLSSLGVIPAVLLWNNTWALQCSALLFVFAYLWLYRCIIRFRAPRCWWSAVAPAVNASIKPGRPPDARGRYPRCESPICFTTNAHMRPPSPDQCADGWLAADSTNSVANPAARPVFLLSRQR